MMLKLRVSEAIVFNDLESQISGLQTQIAQLQAQLDAIIPEDGIGQADVDAAVAALTAQCDEDNANAYLEGEENGYNVGLVEGYDSGFSDGAASVEPEDGISQSDVDAAIANGEAIANDLQAQLEEALSNSGGVMGRMKL